MRLLTHLIQPTIASSCLHENKWNSQNPNLNYISKGPKKETETFVGILKFWSRFMRSLSLSRSKKQNRFFSGYYHLPLTCWTHLLHLWVTPSQLCTLSHRQSVGSPLTACLTPIQENTWIREGQLISVRDAVRQLLCATLFLSLLRRVLVTWSVEYMEHSLL